jgi:hypothetical protein
LNKEINRYIKNKDFKTAENLVKNLGPLIEGFDMNKAFEKINEAKK